LTNAPLFSDGKDRVACLIHKIFKEFNLISFYILDGRYFARFFRIFLLLKLIA